MSKSTLQITSSYPPPPPYYKSYGLEGGSGLSPPPCPAVGETFTAFGVQYLRGTPLRQTAQDERGDDCSIPSKLVQLNQEVVERYKGVLQALVSDPVNEAGNAITSLEASMVKVYECLNEARLVQGREGLIALIRNQLADRARITALLRTTSSQAKILLEEEHEREAATRRSDLEALSSSVDKPEEGAASWEEGKMAYLQSLSCSQV